MSSWDALGILLWLGLPAWAGGSLYRLARSVPEEEPPKWDGLTPTLFRGLLFGILGHLLYAATSPWLPLVTLPVPRVDELKQRLFDPPHLLSLGGVVIMAALAGGVGGLLNGWAFRLWRRLRHRATVSARTVWDEVFDGRQARWAVLYLSGGKVYEGQVERWSGPDEAEPHVLLTSPSEYLQIETPEGARWHVLDLQSDGLLIPRARVELIELRPTVAEWEAQQAPKEMALAAEGR